MQQSVGGLISHHHLSPSNRSVDNDRAAESGTITQSSNKKRSQIDPLHAPPMMVMRDRFYRGALHVKGVRYGAPSAS